MAAARETDPRVLRSKQAVTDATLSLLTERGFAGTSIEAIAERSAVAKTTIYRHWPGKAELVVEAVESLGGPPPGRPDTGDLRQDLVALLEALAERLTDSPWGALVPTLVDAAERDEQFARLQEKLTAPRRRALIEVLEAARDRGDLPADTDVAAVVEVLASPLFLRRLISRQPLDADVVRRSVDTALAAIRAGTLRA